ncbi:hypothetical protein D9M72_407530 [compost metagenome]
MTENCMRQYIVAFDAGKQDQLDRIRSVLSKVRMLRKWNELLNESIDVLTQIQNGVVIVGTRAGNDPGIGRQTVQHVFQQLHRTTRRLRCVRVVQPLNECPELLGNLAQDAQLIFADSLPDLGVDNPEKILKKLDNLVRRCSGVIRDG